MTSPSDRHIISLWSVHQPFGTDRNRVRTCELDLITEISERCTDVVAVAKFATAVHANILGRAGRCVISEPLIEPVNGRGFGGKGAPKNAAAEVVSDQDVTGLTVETDQIVETRGCFAFLDHESEIDRQTLETDGGNHGGSGPTRRSAKLGSKADSTIVNGIGHGDHGDAASVAVELRQFPEVKMAKALVPKHAEGGAAQAVNGQIGNIGRGKFWERVECWRQSERKGRRGGREQKRQWGHRRCQGAHHKTIGCTR